MQRALTRIPAMQVEAMEVSHGLIISKRTMVRIRRTWRNLVFISRNLCLFWVLIEFFKFVALFN